MFTWTKLEYTYENCNKLASYLSMVTPEECLYNILSLKDNTIPVDTARSLLQEQFLLEYLEDEFQFFSDCRSEDDFLLGR